MNTIDTALPNNQSCYQWWLAIIVFVLCYLFPPAASAATSKQVLLLHSGNENTPGYIILKPIIKATMQANSDSPLEFYSEYMDAERFTQEGYSKLLYSYYQQKYSDKNLDLIVAMRDPGIDFLVKYGNELFPNVPVVFFSYDPSRMNRDKMRPGLTGSIVAFNYRATLDLALKLHPDTDRIIVVAGSAKLDQGLLANAQPQFSLYSDKFQINYLIGLTQPELKESLSHLSNHTIIIYLVINQDRSGAVFLAPEALRYIAGIANRPIYSISETYLDKGTVGGYMLNPELMGKALGQFGSRILNGEKPDDIPVQQLEFSQYIFDWKQLQRWGIDERSLPPGSIIKFKPVSFWDNYKSYIIAFNSFMIIETALIIALLIQRSRRRQFEKELLAERALLTERVAARTADLTLANVELTRASRQKDEFLASMSHELRTPLNAILGLSEVLRDNVYGPLNNDQAESIDLIRESGGHLLDLINDILDLAKIEVGKLELKITTVALAPICQSSTSFIRPSAQKKNINLSLLCDDSITTIETDALRLKQILINLLSNAVKFTPDNGSIGLAVNQDVAEQLIKFTVWDTGIGIAKEELSQLFQPFVQLDNRLNRQQTGTGLGLALVSRMAEMLGGNITVESEEGQGSRFTVALPLAPARSGADTAHELLPVNECISATSPQTDKDTHIAAEQFTTSLPQILLAEDNNVNIKIYLDYLTRQRYRVAVAHNGREAIELARKISPDLIIMDIQMPVMDGLEAMRWIKADPQLRQTPIVALTALIMPGDRERCFQAGADDYLSKPVNLTSLINSIDKLIRSARGHN